MTRGSDANVSDLQLLIGMYDVFVKTPTGETNGGVALVTVDEHTGIFTEHYLLTDTFRPPRAVGEELILRMTMVIGAGNPEEIAEGWRLFLAFKDANPNGRWVTAPCFNRPAS